MNIQDDAFDDVFQFYVLDNLDILDICKLAICCRSFLNRVKLYLRQNWRYVETIERDFDCIVQEMWPVPVINQYPKQIHLEAAFTQLYNLDAACLTRDYLDYGFPTILNNREVVGNLRFKLRNIPLLIDPKSFDEYILYYNNGNPYIFDTSNIIPKEFVEYRDFQETYIRYAVDHYDSPYLDLTYLNRIMRQEKFGYISVGFMSLESGFPDRRLKQLVNRHLSSFEELIKLIKRAYEYCPGSKLTHTYFYVEKNEKTEIQSTILLYFKIP